MKLVNTLLLLVLVGVAQSFSTSNQVRHSTKLFGLFDFKVFHGSGSGKEELDEQWRTQQEILAARRGHTVSDHSPRMHQSKKRSTPQLHHTEAPGEDVPRVEGKPKIKFFWEK